MRFLLLLLLVAPLQAQTWTTIGYEWANTFDIPAGSYTFQMGCPGKWSTTLTLTGPQTARQILYPNFGLKTDIKGCPGSATAKGQPEIQVQTQPAAFTLGIWTWNGSVYTGPAPMTIPPTSPPSTVCTTPPALIYAPDGTVTITIPPYCMLIQQGGAYGNIQTTGYFIIIQGDSSLPLFANINAGTNGPH